VMKKNKTQAEFDDFAEKYRSQQDQHLAATGDDSDYYAKYKVHKLASWKPQLLAKENNILDFGCGDGLMSYYLAYYFNRSKVHGIDISSESIEIAKSFNYKNIEFSAITNKIDFSDNYFDIICAAGVFHHIPPDEHKLWAKELIRVLKPGGICVIFELNPLNPGTQYIFWNHPMEKNAKMLWPWQTKKLFVNTGKTENKFFCYFPNWLKYFREYEPYFEKIPFGGLYACITEKVV